MSSKRGQAGRVGISGSASVSMEKIAGEDAGDPVPLPADENDDLLLAKMVGEDDNGDFQRVATDSNGRIKVKDVQFDGTVDIGDLQVMDTTETKIDPATEQTVSELLTESVFQQSQNSSDELVIDIATNTANLFEESDFTETRTISQNNAGLFEASDFTEARNVRELQNESSVTSGKHSGGGSLPSNAVPDGKAVSVKAQYGNDGAVQINGDYPLLEGDSVKLRVQNTDQISYTTDNGTEGVAFIVEG